MVALRNNSGHDTPVSSPVVNEKGIVVSFAHSYWSIKFSCLQDAELLACVPETSVHLSRARIETFSGSHGFL